MTLWWIAALLFGFAIFVEVLRRRDIDEWIDEVDDDEAYYAELVRKRLDDGNFKVVTGIFDSDGDLLEDEVWECEALSPGLKRLFGGKKYVCIDLS